MCIIYQNGCSNKYESKINNAKMRKSDDGGDAEWIPHTSAHARPVGAIGATWVEQQVRFASGIAVRLLVCVDGVWCCGERFSVVWCDIMELDARL